MKKKTKASGSIEVPVGQAILPWQFCQQPAFSRLWPPGKAK
jgi:hypothetical protein